MTSHFELDILTPNGRVTVEYEQKAIEIWAEHFPLISYCETPKDKTSSVDAVMVKDNQILSVVETKCRINLTRQSFAEKFDSLWLVTLNKIWKAKETADYLKVPFVGFLYLVDEDILLFNTIWSPEKGWNVEFKVSKTETSAGVNGGQIFRDNAYIDMTNAKILRRK